MTIPPLDHRVCWREGVCVSPQHFQQQERFLESQAKARFSAIAPSGWGVHQLDVDAAELSQGNFALLGLTAVMPDGLAIDLRQSAAQPVPPARSIAEHFGERETSLTVYLTLPKASSDFANYARPTDNPPAPQDTALRYRIEDRSLKDNGRQHSERRIEVLRPEFQVCFGAQGRDGQDALPIARLLRTAGQGYALDPEFIPPCLNLSAAPSLRTQLHRMLELGLSCYRELQARRPQREELAGRDLMTYLRLGAISTHLPELEQCARDATAPPLQAHQTLARLAGQLWALFDHPEPIRVPPYRHDDLAGTFTPLLTLVKDLLTRCVAAPRPFLELPLVSDGQGLWTTQLDDPRLAQAERFLLSIISTMPPEQSRDMVQTRCKIASKTQIEAVVERAVSGARLVAPVAPAGIALRPREVHLEFDLHDGYWRDLFFERTFALHADEQVITPENQPRLLALLPDQPHHS